MNQVLREEKLIWALSLKPGDLVNDCAACAREIISVEFIYRDNKQLNDIHFHFEDGTYCSALHCCYPTTTPTEIL